jgi:hypothetical protein
MSDTPQVLLAHHLRIFERLRDEHGYTGGITIVKDYVHERRQRQREMFVPLRHDPGHAQVDFGEALAVIGGVERKIHFFAMDLPHSDSCLVQDLSGSTLPRIVNAFLGQDWESVIKSIESFTFRGTKIAQSLWREPCSRKSQIASDACPE